MSLAQHFTVRASTLQGPPASCGIAGLRALLGGLFSLGDLPVAVDHLDEQPQGEEDQEDVHHDLGDDGGEVLSGCKRRGRLRVHTSANPALPSGAGVSEAGSERGL